MVKLGQANNVRVSNHCDLFFDLWTKFRVSTYWLDRKQLRTNYPNKIAR